MCERCKTLEDTIHHVLTHGHVGKQSERRLRAALASVAAQPASEEAERMTVRVTRRRAGGPLGYPASEETGQ